MEAPHPGPPPSAEREKRAVIIAARGVTLSSNFLSGRLETDAIALHGDERYQPCGWTALHDSALEIRDEVGFLQEVRAVLAKSISEGGGKSPEELDLAVRQIVSRAISSNKVIDIFDAAGLKKPDISILSDEFLAEVQHLPQRNLAVELLQIQSQRD